MPSDPYAVLHALVRAEAVRGTQPRPEPEAEHREESHTTAPPEDERE